jgi:hypothetical protein
VADRLATLQRNPAMARAMGEAGLRRACRHYTWRSVAQQVAAVYAAVLAEAQARAPIDLTLLQEQAWPSHPSIPPHTS